MAGGTLIKDVSRVRATSRSRRPNLVGLRGDRVAGYNRGFIFFHISQRHIYAAHMHAGISHAASMLFLDIERESTPQRVLQETTGAASPEITAAPGVQGPKRAGASTLKGQR